MVIYMSLRFLKIYIQKYYQSPISDLSVDVTSHWGFLVTYFHIRPLRFSALHKKGTQSQMRQ
jgi:hypothetical protein